MSKPVMSKYNTPANKMIAVAALVAAAAGYYFVSSSSLGGADRVTFPVQRGILRVTVLEGGNIEARESQEIKSEIKGRNGATILSIVDEGHLVTQKDIDEGLILVELDTAELKDELVNQEIALQGAEASFIERKAQYEIQMNQNQSSIAAAELAVKFARMDFQKFLGANSVQDIVKLLDLEARFADKPTEIVRPKRVNVENAPGGRGGRRSGPGAPQAEGEPQAQQQGQGRPGGPGGAPGAEGGGGRRGFDPERIKQMIADNGGELPSMIKDRLPDMGLTEEEFMARLNGGDAAGARPTPPAAQPEVAPMTEIAVTMDEEYLRLRNSIDFSKYADERTLEDGEAKQMLSTLKADALVAQEDFRLAETRAAGQRRLAEKEFITKTELELELVKMEKARIRVDSAGMERDLYIKYTFPKEAERLFSQFEEALMDLVRTRKEGEAKLAQESAQLSSSERKYNLEDETFKDLQDQLAKCVIRAERPGLVVYGSSGNSSPWRRNDEQPILEGSTVRERQQIITIPDMTRMGVKVNIHESSIKKVSVGQKVTVTVQAFPELKLSGEVVKVAVLADSANAFMNPDLKVYPTEIKIDGSHDWLRPGMSAEAEILVEELDDVVYIPIQAVTYEGDKRICYVMQGGSPQKREVTLGSFTEEFIEIKSGLTEGENVLLLAPGSGSSDSKEKKEEGATTEETVSESEPQPTD